MKHIKTLALVSVLVFGMTTSVFASWWNPLTWGWFRKEKVLQQVEIKTTSPIAVKVDNGDNNNWKTYKNVECNFSVKYPENWKLGFNTDFKTCDKFIFWIDSPTMSTLAGFQGVPMKYSVYFSYSSSEAITVISEFVGTQINQLALPVTYDKTTYTEYKMGQQIIKSFKDSLSTEQNNKLGYTDRY